MDKINKYNNINKNKYLSYKRTMNASNDACVSCVSYSMAYVNQ